MLEHKETVLHDEGWGGENHVTGTLDEGYRDVKQPGWFAQGNWGSNV